MCVDHCSPPVGGCFFFNSSELILALFNAFSWRSVRERRRRKRVAAITISYQPTGRTDILEAEPNKLELGGPHKQQWWLDVILLGGGLESV